MATIASPAPRSARPRTVVGYALGAGLLGLILAALLYRFPPPLALALAGGLAMLAVLALAVSRHHAAVALGFGLLGVVVVEPAPSDGVFLVLMAIAVVGRRFRVSATPLPVLAALGTFAALNLLSAVQVADTARAAEFFLITLFVAAIGLWVPSYVVTRRRARLVLRGYLFAAVSSALVGVLALFVPLPAADLLTEGGRARGLFQDPNVFGPFLIPALLIVVEEIVHPRLLTSRLAAKALMAAALAAGVLFCYSRGAWLNLGIGLAVMCAVLAVRRGGARRALGLVGVAVVTAAIVGGTVAATGSGDFLSERARPQTYDQQRFSGQRVSLETASRYPFGAGPGQFESIAGISAHSTYARVLGEQGFPGMLAVFALFVFTLGAALRNAGAGRGTYGIGSAALAGAWCGLLANSFFIDTLHWRHLWIVAGLIWAGSMSRYVRVTSASNRAARGARA